MRKVFRDKHNNDYWENRWEKSGVDEDIFVNRNIYPIKYADKVVEPGQTVLEAGCGAGRVYFDYKSKGVNIKGIEYSQNAVNNILKKDPSAEVIQGSVTEMPYDDNSFDVVLAFGLYHNIEDEMQLQKSFDETFRVLKPGGKLVASVRFDSFENNLIEKIVKKRGKGKAFDKFHRWHFNLKDMKKFFNGKLEIEKVFYTRNVSFMFKYDLFRKSEMKSATFSESQARSNGFQLNLAGRIIDSLLHFLIPGQFSNLLVMIAKKI
jgi:ubiquinone/menaquinone biosynthesis C-methylase UbiE